MNRPSFYLAIACVAALLTGCAVVRSDVSVFHSLSNPPQPATYSFFPLKNQSGSLEYKTYQDRVRTNLAKYGFKEVPIDHQPQLIVAFAYGIDSGREELKSIPIFGQTGVSSAHTSGRIDPYGNVSATTIYQPTYGVTGSMTQTTTVYGRGLSLYMVDSSSVGSEELRIVYEGNVKSRGSSGQLAPVMPAMIDALFAEFPGKSGATRREYGSTQ